jgi:hypothetical protein
MMSLKGFGSAQSSLASQGVLDQLTRGVASVASVLMPDA